MTDVAIATTVERRDGPLASSRRSGCGPSSPRRVGDPELAADLTQDVIVRSIASGALERVENPTAWLYRSARNAVIDHYRTRVSTIRHRRAGPLARPGTVRQPNPTRRPESWHAASSLSSANCPTRARDALTRVDLDGQTHPQAAAELGISVSGMKSRVQRATTPTQGPAHRLLPGGGRSRRRRVPLPHSTPRCADVEALRSTPRDVRVAAATELWALRDSNPRPPPCKASAAKRCAQPRFRRSALSETRTVRG